MGPLIFEGCLLEDALGSAFPHVANGSGEQFPLGEEALADSRAERSASNGCTVAGLFLFYS
jgi:hypothetical protein